MTKDNTPSLFINSPVRKSLQRLVQNQTLWTAPLIAILFASLIRWIVALNPYSGKRKKNNSNYKQMWTTHLNVCANNRL